MSEKPKRKEFGRLFAVLCVVIIVPMVAANVWCGFYAGSEMGIKTIIGSVVCLLMILAIFLLSKWVSRRCKNCGRHRRIKDGKYCQKCADFLAPPEVDTDEFPRYDFGEYVRHSIRNNIQGRFIIFFMLAPFVFYTALVAIREWVFGVPLSNTAGAVGFILVIVLSYGVPILLLKVDKSKIYTCPKCKYPLNGDHKLFTESKRCPRCGILLFKLPEESAGDR